MGKRKMLAVKSRSILQEKRKTTETDIEFTKEGRQKRSL